MAVANARTDMNSDVAALYIESMNDVINVHAMRVSIGLHARIPTGIWLALYALIVLGMFAVGYHTAIAESKRTWMLLVLALAFSLVITLIGALDRAQSGYLPVSQHGSGSSATRFDDFPPTASRACALVFFPDPTSRSLAWDQVELSTTRACLGRLYFKVPGGIACIGQHWLNVKFENSLVRVPFRILTKEEEQTLSKNYKDISKQVKDAFKKKKN